MAKAPRVPGASGAAPQSEGQTAAAAAPAADEGLPNAIDIDPRAIKGPVLTRQGYVCPDEAWQKANPEAFKALLAAKD